MLLSNSACRRALPKASAVPIDPIWFDDDILREAWYRFARPPSRCSKRHGSNVPGPLEFRRRLAKRRMMDVAARGGTQAGPPPGFDLGALFGWQRRATKHELKWEPPSPPALTAAAPDLPSWLTAPIPLLPRDGRDAESQPDGGAEDSVVGRPISVVGTPNSSIRRPIGVIGRPSAPESGTMLRMPDLRSSKPPPRFIPEVQDIPDAKSVDAVIPGVQTTPLTISSSKQALDSPRDLAQHKESPGVANMMGHEELADRLSKASNINEIASMLQLWNLGGQGNTEHVAKSVLQRLFQLNISCAKTINFMADRRLEFTAPMVKHLMFRCTQHRLRPHEYRLLLEMVTISLGQANPNSVWTKMVFQRLPKIVNMMSDDFRGKQSALLKGYAKALSALLADERGERALVPPDIVRKITSELAIMPPSMQASRLLLDMANSIAKLQPNGYISVSRAISRCLVAWARQLSGPATSHEDGIALFRRIRDALRPIFNSLPHCLLANLAEHSIKLLLLTDDPVTDKLQLKWTLVGFLAGLQGVPAVESRRGPILDAVSRHFKLAMTRDLGLPLASLSNLEIRNLYLQHWVEPDLRLRSKNRAAEPTLISEVYSQIKQIIDSKPPNSYTRMIHPYFALIRALAVCGVAYDDHLAEILDVLHRINRPIAIKKLLHILEEDPVVKLKPRIVLHCVRKLVDIEPRIARVIFDNHPSVRLRQCPRLPISLIANTPTHPEKIFRLLDRQDRHNTRPVKSREIIFDKLSQARVHLIHEMAMAFAQAPHWRPRSAFRMVWRCYRYLRDRQAPLYPTLTKALVHCGLARPLQEGRWVSSVLFRWILGLIEQVEGKKVADEMNELMWSWRGRVVADSMLRRRRGEAAIIVKKQLLRGPRRGTMLVG